MKKTYIYSALLVAGMGLTTSCGSDFLEIDPAGSVSEGTLMTTEGVNQVLTGAYSILYGNYGNQWTMGERTFNNWVFADITGGDANGGSIANDQASITALETFVIAADNSYLRDKWRTMYEGVKRANNTISMAQRLGDNLPNKDQIIAQAQFLKGSYYFELIRMYGAAVPYITVEDYEANTDPQVSNVDENGNYIYIWDKVEKDLTDAMNVLKTTYSNPEDYGRATKFMAEAMLAKLQMYWASPYNGKNGANNTAKWAEAKSHLQNIYDNGVDAKGQKYRLAPTYEMLFTPEGDWAGESVFDIQTYVDGSNVGGNTILSGYITSTPGLGGWGFFQPTYEFVNHFLVNEDGLPLKNYTDKDPLTNPGTMTQDLNTYTDPRIDITVGRFDMPYWSYGTPEFKNYAAWIRDYSNGGLYMNKKYISTSMDERAGADMGTSTYKNFHVIRFADIILMLAECELETTKDLSKVCSLINEVRSRAAKSCLINPAGTAYTLDDKVNNTTKSNAAANYRIGLYTAFGTIDEATEALRREIRLEFGMESHRWFDLTRWGIVKEVLDKFLKYEENYFAKYKGRTYPANAFTYPIPQDDILTAEGRLVQGENWVNAN